MRPTAQLATLLPGRQPAINRVSTTQEETDPILILFYFYVSAATGCCGCVGDSLDTFGGALHVDAAGLRVDSVESGRALHVLLLL